MMIPSEPTTPVLYRSSGDRDKVHSSTRIVVFTGDLSYSVRKGVVHLNELIPNISWLIVLHSPKKSLRMLIRNQWRNYLRNGWRWIPHQCNEIYRLLKSPAANEYTTGPGSDLTLGSLTARANVRLIQVPDINSTRTIAAVRSFEPDLGLSLASPILKQSLFSLPRLGTLNLHKGKVPEYRGMPPAFWELWNDERSVGCTVHKVNEGLDTGDVISCAEIDRSQFSTLRGLQLQLDEIGVQLTAKAAKDLLAGGASPEEQRTNGRTFRKPTLQQVTELKRRLRTTQPRGTTYPKLLIENTASSAGRLLWQAGLARLRTPRVTVLLYHRVSDDARNNLTTGIEQFDRQMALVRKCCHPISIEEVVNCASIPRTNRPLVAVTFDDGYLDNHTHAAPILMRHGIPAAFFVSTGVVESNGRFAHDIRRGYRHVPIMNWDQLREMQQNGFTIGSHTVNHIDCAAEPEERVRAELTESRDQLRRKLGVTDPLFAYPYGGRENMTPERLEWVKEAGYAGCLSAYGGINVETVDPFNVLRNGIHWTFSDAAFLIACMGLR